MIELFSNETGVTLSFEVDASDSSYPVSSSGFVGIVGFGQTYTQVRGPVVSGVLQISTEDIVILGAGRYFLLPAVWNTQGDVVDLVPDDLIIHFFDYGGR